MTIQSLRKQFEKDTGNSFIFLNYSNYIDWLEKKYIKLYHRREGKIEYIHVKGYPENGD